jgi:serine-type D-Ala-D-Ala carboxypeptidase/endopeptidase (penicillin-binding protein 4)
MFSFNRMRLLVVFFVLIAFPGYTQIPEGYDNPIQRAADRMMSEASLKHASMSFFVYDLDSNTVLADHDGSKSLVPASTMKLVTTATALQQLGSYYVFKTHLEYDGEIDTASRTLNGNIYIKGGGDPTLGSKYFAKANDAFKTEWLNAIRKLGIDSINGAVIADASWYTDDMVPSTWVWGDIANYFGAGPSGLTVYDNTYHLEFSSGPNSGDSTTIECVRPYVPDLIVENRVKSANIRNDQAYIFGAPFDHYKIAQGKIPKNKELFEVKGSIPDPAYQVAWELNWILRDSGIVVNNMPTTVRRLRQRGKISTKDRITFYTRKSPSLARIVYWTNLLSVNLYAEHLLRAVAKSRYKDGSNFSGTVAITKYWNTKGVITSGMYVHDGSGLSRHNAISAKHLVDVLGAMNKSKYFKSFKSSLPVAGKTGTMKSMCVGTSAHGNLRAKSGTMSRVKSYAGYVTSKSGRNLAFAIIVNNHTCSHKVLKKKIEQLMVAMASYTK